ncbi:uncharacterized protein LOC128211963 [Mya arenaria]|uniref:uncharacterized protein LOC128211963 n=1 Tax=Mya arenaria TaxID=6604 RepID=UPI0022E6F86A|nr:uncharacterized protein LOC128211963 [Mya arenaria]
MCSTSIILVFLITEYLIISSIIGISVAIGQDESISDGHSGDSPPALDLALSGTSVAFEKDGAEDIDYSGEQSGETATIELDGEDGMTSQGDSTSTSEAAVPGCPNGTFGVNCDQTCSCNQTNTDICDKVDGNCQCNPSWKGTSCEEDVDECKPPKPFLDPCVIKPHTVCENTIGSYECKCIAGYWEEDDTGCTAKDYSMIWYIGGGIGGAIVLNVGIVCIVFFVRRRNRANDSSRYKDDSLGFGKHQFKKSLSVTEGQAKEYQENNANNSPKNHNDPFGLEIHKLESFLPVSEVKPKEDQENSAINNPKNLNDPCGLEIHKREFFLPFKPKNDQENNPNDGSKTMNDICGGEKHELDSVLPLAEVQPKEDQKTCANDDSMNLNDICDMQLHLFESFLPLPEAEVQATEGKTTSDYDAPKLESFLPIAEDQTTVGQETSVNDCPRILNDDCVV